MSAHEFVTVDDLLSRLAGCRMPGGCDDCNAYQEMAQLAPGVWSLGVFHDTGCPALAARKKAS